MRGTDSPIRRIPACRMRGKKRTERRHTMTREEWLGERRQGIGGSDAAAVLVLNPYMGPVAVYNDKIGIGSEVVETEAMKWGRKLEPFVADAFMDRHPEYRLGTPPEYHTGWAPPVTIF